MGPRQWYDQFKDEWMYAAKIRHLASVFVDATSIFANSSNIAGLSAALNDKTLVPIVVRESNLNAPNRNRIGFTSENGEWRITLVSNRFDFAHMPTDHEGSNLGDFSAFCREALPKLKTTLNYFNRRPHRLAAVQEGFLPEMSKRELEGIVNRLFHTPSTYHHHMPFEWDWRMASKIDRQLDDLVESTNTLTTIKRMTGQFVSTEIETNEQTEVPFDRIRVDIDINTSQEDVRARFEDRHISYFFENSGLWHNQLISEISAFIYEENKQ